MRLNINKELIITFIIVSIILYLSSLWDFSFYYFVTDIIGLNVAVAAFLTSYNISRKIKYNYLYIIGIGLFTSSVFEALHLIHHINVIPQANPQFGGQLYLFSLLTFPLTLIVTGYIARKKYQFSYLMVNIIFIIYFLLISYFIFGLNLFEDRVLLHSNLTLFEIILSILTIFAVILFIVWSIKDINEDKYIQNNILVGLLLLIIYYAISFSTISVESPIGKLSLLVKIIAYVFFYRALIQRSIMLILEESETLQRELKERNKELIKISIHDSLTGLYNRYYLQKEIDKLENDHLVNVAILIGDVNGLKLTNDVFGHDVGDELLKSIGRILYKLSNRDTVVGRWSGDEFVVIMLNANERKVNSFINKININCDECKNKEVIPDITFGYEIKTEISQDLETIMSKAEENMYSKKLLAGRTQKTDILKSLEKLLFEKSQETEIHTKRISDKATSIGKELNLKEIDLINIGLVSRMHDIGKVAIRDSILKKPGKLTASEWVEMQKHPEIGYRIAKTDPTLSSVAEYILTHHENYDGSGYPQGLKKEEIPLISRIIRVVDAYDAMINDRIYRKALTHTQAIEELIKYKGSWFDPNIIEIFLNLYNRS